MLSGIVIPDLSYWKDQIKCQSACPVHTDARGYIRAIANGENERAYLIARGPNPLASLCGRVCGAPCEESCRRGDIDKPISIRALKRYICEQFGPENGFNGSGSLVEFIKDAAKRNILNECSGQEELLSLMQAVTDAEIKPVSGRSVGVVGSGPAGLAAAHDLAILGFDVTIYEMESELAGMLLTGVPEYRLPRDLIKAEIEVILALGVKAETNCTVGKDVTIPELRERHDAVVVAVGAKKSRALNIKGADGKGVIGGVEFLRDVAVGNPPSLGKKVVVIGGGNVAYDVGRTVLRQISLDAARSAVRSEGVGEVHLCSLESLEEMPAEDMEIIHGEEEGIVRQNSLGPTEIVLDENGTVTGVKFQKCLSVFDENRRFNPQFDADDVIIIECDHVLISIGQDFDLTFIDSKRDGIELTERGLIKCHPVDGTTSAKDIFVAGDLAYGPKLMIHAVASGKKIARSIYQQLTGNALSVKATELHFPLPEYSREKSYEGLARVELNTISVEERFADQGKEVERVFSSEQAQCEASRCLDCGINTIFDGERCILCGGCVDVCPKLCLRISSVNQIAFDPTNKSLVDNYLEEFPTEEASFILKNEQECIRCALCAERCPSGAITMEKFNFKEKLTCLAD
jgi:formate dehydrogenase beta subunit